MAGAAGNIFVGLDMGTSGVSVAVLEARSGVEPRLIGAGFCPSAGVDRGMVVRVEDAVASIREAVKEAGLTAGVEISHVYAAVGMPGMIASRAAATLALNRRRAVTPGDTGRVQRDLCAAVLPSGYTVVQLAGIRYYINGKPVALPHGARGRKLEARACVLAAPGEQLSNLLRCPVEAGLKVKQTVAGPLAVAEALLNGLERELGVVCVDMGAGLTRVTYINHGQLEGMEIIPAGSGHITSDLAVGLHTTLQAAEKIKIQYGLRPIDGHVGVPALAGSVERSVPGNVITEIIRLRAGEILDLINQYINKLQLTGSLPGGIVLAGGGSRLAGLAEMAEAVLGMPVRDGACWERVPARWEGVPEEEAFRYITAMGAGLWGCARERPARGVARKTGAGIWGRLKTWL